MSDFYLGLFISDEKCLASVLCFPIATHDHWYVTDSPLIVVMFFLLHDILRIDGTPYHGIPFTHFNITKIKMSNLSAFIWHDNPSYFSIIEQVKWNEIKEIIHK